MHRYYADLMAMGLCSVYVRDSCPVGEGMANAAYTEGWCVSAQTPVHR